MLSDPDCCLTTGSLALQERRAARVPVPVDVGGVSISGLCCRAGIGGRCGTQSRSAAHTDSRSGAHSAAVVLLDTVVVAVAIFSFVKVALGSASLFVRHPKSAGVQLGVVLNTQKRSVSSVT